METVSYAGQQDQCWRMIRVFFVSCSYDSIIGLLEIKISISNSIFEMSPTAIVTSTLALKNVIGECLQNILALDLRFLKSGHLCTTQYCTNTQIFNGTKMLKNRRSKSESIYYGAGTIRIRVHKYNDIRTTTTKKTSNK